MVRPQRALPRSPCRRREDKASEVAQPGARAPAPAGTRTCSTGRWPGRCASDPTRPVVTALRRPARAAARRHRQPPLLRLVPRRHGRHGRRATALAPPGPVRLGVRRPGRAGVGRLHGAGALARPRLGRGSTSATTSNPSTSTGSCPPDEFATFDDWRAATQAYQAALIQLQVEDLRRLRYRPTGGFLQFCFADGHPGVTWSVLDHERRPKPGHAALAAACRSVLPMVDPRTGHVHVVNELRRPFPGAEIEVRIGDEHLALRRRPGRRLAGLRRDGPLPPGCTGLSSVVLHHPDVASRYWRTPTATPPAPGGARAPEPTPSLLRCPTDAPAMARASWEPETQEAVQRRPAQAAVAELRPHVVAGS